MLVEAVGQVVDEVENTVLISPDDQKIKDILEIETPSSKKECQMISGCAAQLKKFFPGMQLQYPGIMHLCSPNVRFHWNSELQKELEDLKDCLKNHIKLSPIDTSKNLTLVIDSAAIYYSRTKLMTLLMGIISSQWTLVTSRRTS